MLHGVVYCITNTLNGKQYVGSTVQVIDCNQLPLTIANQRNQDRFTTNEKSPIANAQRELGRENFRVEILVDLGLSQDRKVLQEEGFKWEKYWIARLNTFHAGYNCSEDGKWTKPTRSFKCIETGHVFLKGQEASDFFGVNVSTIYDVLANRLKHVKGRDGACYHLIRL